MDEDSKSEPSQRPLQKRWGRVRGPLVVVVALLAAPSIAYLYWVEVEHRFYALDEGEVYRSAQMSPERVVRTAEERGLRTVIDFRRWGPEVDAERIALDRIGVKHVHIPSEQVPDQKSVDRFLSVVRGSAASPLLLHCKHGVGRAGVFSAIYRMEFEDWSNEKALAEARRLSGYGSFETDSPKAHFIRNYHPADRRP